MTKPTKMTLYICPECNDLLLWVEKKYDIYNDSFLDENGHYVDDRQQSPMLTAYVCSNCGRERRIDYPETSDGLRSIVLPIELAPELLKLQVEEGNVQGISLDNLRLKELLTEHLI
jgi:DNA-directed RNA polymerase subunit RPC12/RpoP